MMIFSEFIPTEYPFGGFQARLEQAQVLVFSSPFDATASFRAGTHLAPEKIRYYMANLETINIFNSKDLSDVFIHDLGNLPASSDLSFHLQHLQHAFHYAKQHQLFPLMFGGEHTITRASIDTHRDIHYLILDAHLDLRDSYYVNNILSSDSHASVMHHVGEQIGYDKLIFLGTRALSPEELQMVREYNISVFTIKDIRQYSFSHFLKEQFMPFLENNTIHSLYLSLDVDCFDPAVAPGVGNPEPFGLSSWEVATLIQFIASRLVGADIVEFNPVFDPSGQTGTLVARIAHLIATSVLFS